MKVAKVAEVACFFIYIHFLQNPKAQNIKDALKIAINQHDLPTKNQY